MFREGRFLNLLKFYIMFSINKYLFSLTLAIAGLIINLNVSSAQNFGKNKVIYDNFNFKILETPTFNIYYYLKNKEKISELGHYAEIWNKLHQAVLIDTLPVKNPIILYNNHADFQQTNAISGEIGVGTGGVTEAFKNRVIMPLTFSKA